MSEKYKSTIRTTISLFVFVVVFVVVSCFAEICGFTAALIESSYNKCTVATGVIFVIGPFP